MIKEWRIQKVSDGNGEYNDIIHCSKELIIEDIDADDYQEVLYYFPKCKEFGLDGEIYDKLYEDLEIKCSICGELVPDYILFQFLLLCSGK